LSKVREDVLAGKDVRPRDVAKAGNYSGSTVYSWASQGKIASRKVHGCLFILNSSARYLLGLEEVLSDLPAEPGERDRRAGTERLGVEASAA